MVLRKLQGLNGSSRFGTSVAFSRRVRDAGLFARHRWRWLVSQNPSAASRFRSNPPALEAPARRAVAALAQRGIALLSLTDLGAEPGHWERLANLGKQVEQGVSQLLDSSTPREANFFLSHNAEKTTRYLRGEGRSDDYRSVPSGGSGAVVSDPLLRFGLGPSELGIVNSYLGLWGRLIYTDLWRTLPAAGDKRVGSQIWHRDHDDARITKAYLYLNEVGSESGPLQYVPGSQLGGEYRSQWPWRKLISQYVPEGELERRIPEDQWVTAVGPPGTIVLCDTSGLHRGGPSTKGVRLLATWTFVTAASLHLRRSAARSAVHLGFARTRRLAISAVHPLRRREPLHRGNL